MTEPLQAAYDQEAERYGTVRNPHYDAFRDTMLDWFAELVAPVGDRVLDLGAGPGHEAVLLAGRGLRPLALDFAPRMVEECRQRGVDAEVADLRRLDLPAESFAGAWASFSLLHLPKAELAPVLAAVARALRPGGVLMVLLFEGDGEGPRAADVGRFGVARHFSYYRGDELRAALTPSLVDIEIRRLAASPRPTLVAAGRTPTDSQDKGALR